MKKAAWEIAVCAAVLILFALIANVTLLLYDRALGIAAGLYHRRLRGLVIRTGRSRGIKKPVARKPQAGRDGHSD